MSNFRTFTIILISITVAVWGVLGAFGATAEENNAVNYFDVQQTDPFGQRSIAVIGDSISHGANAPKIYEQSYLAIVKKALWADTGVENYGFASVENTMWNSKGEYHEVHNASWAADNRWKEERINDDLGRMRVSATAKGAALRFTVQKNFRYFTVYYEKNPDGGVFDVVTSGGQRYRVDTSQGLDGYSTIGRSEMIAFPADKQFTLEVVSEGKPVGINGVGYYQDPQAPVINNYASNGSKLIDVSDEIIRFVCHADTLIMAHNYNDSHFQGNVQANRDEFTRKINLIIRTVKQTGCRVIVHDLSWGLGHTDFYRSELQRLAEETGALYVSAQDQYGQPMLDMLSDNVHPSVQGHQVIGEYLVSRMRGEPAPQLQGEWKPQRFVWLLNEASITSGRNHVTVNADGSWSITGNVELSPGVIYDYNEMGNLSQWFESDVPYTICVTDNLSHQTFDLAANFVEGTYRYPLGSFEAVNDMGGIYRWSVKNSQWPETQGQARIDKITVELQGEGTLTIHSLALTTGSLTVTFPGEHYPGIPGDWNNNGYTDINDALDLFHAVAGGGQLPGSDLDNNGTTDMLDAYYAFLLANNIRVVF